MDSTALRSGFRVLMVWPDIPPSFWSLQGIMQIIGRKAVMPPLGLITVAAMCPVSWEIRLVDEALEELNDEQLLWADVVMVSAMHVQRDSAHEVLRRARALGRRTMIGGPYASAQPEVVAELADHVVVGEPDAVFDEIARDLEKGTARPLYTITERPDLTHTPVPRFELLELDAYAVMPIQFSRGCPFQCEFCDIITIYGRKPRTKLPAQVTTELQKLYELGWRKEVFVVDDNFIGHRKKALELAQVLGVWQRERGYPFPFYTEASIDLAQCPEIMKAMVDANFFYVFVGIESPSEASLAEAKKFQNLRQDVRQSIRDIQSAGLWVTGGFIVGFDSDDEQIFARQVALIREAAIPWAMMGFLQAPPTTALWDRLEAEGRLLKESQAKSNDSLPNFRTTLPLPTLVDGYRWTLAELFSVAAFYDRALRSLDYWNARAPQRAPPDPLVKALEVLRSFWYQGVRSSYRRAYWSFVAKLLYRWGGSPRKLWLGFTMLISAHHFVPYAAHVIEELRRAVCAAGQAGEDHARPAELIALSSHFSGQSATSLPVPEVPPVCSAQPMAEPSDRDGC